MRRSSQILAERNDVNSYDTVLTEVATMVSAVLEDGGLGSDITAGTALFGDLDMTSIDLVTLAGRLHARYGQDIRFAKFLAELDMDAIGRLRVGDLVEYVVTARAERTTP
jgi:acyl carrier protein